MSDDRSFVATPSQTVGPFFHFGLVTDIGAAGRSRTAGDRIGIAIRVLDGDGAPLDDALLEWWHRTADGAVAQCGRARTGPDGACGIETARPAGHVNLCLFARGLLRHVYTRIYFPGEATHESDPVLALVPEDRRQTLFATSDGRGGWRFDIHLQGPRETVFFDQ